MLNEHVDDLVDAYALGALEPAEVDEVERHLETCPRCRALAQEARRTAEQLWRAAPPVTPPVSLRGRLMARIAQEKAASASAPPAATPTAGQASDTTPEAEPEPSPAPARGPLSRLAQALRGEPAPQARMASDLLRDLLADPQSVIWPVAGTADAPQASARFVVSRNRRDGVIITNGLGRPGTGKAYQVWLLRGGQPLPNALFMVNRTGIGASVVHADGAWSDFDTIAITPEPVGGSPAPTGPIVLAGALVEQAS